MIESFAHKGLKKFFLAQDVSGIQAKHANRLRLMLGRLNTARVPEDMNFPGFKLHPLKGNRKGTWSVWVSGAWRLTFRLENGKAYDVDYEQYH